jgi:hypothetical protein
VKVKNRSISCNSVFLGLAHARALCYVPSRGLHMHSTIEARNRNPLITVDWLFKIVVRLPTFLRDCGHTVQYIHSTGGT